LGCPGRDALGMPAPPPFLADCRILGAAQTYGLVVGGPANIAADAFTDLIVAAFGDLPRQKGIGDRGPCGADQVLDATLDLARHAVGRSEAADAYHRFRRETLDESNIGLLESLLSETRGTRIIGERAGDIDVPQIGKLG